MEPALLLRRSDRLSVGCRGVPGAADALAVGVTRSLVTREGVDRPAVDGLLLDAVGPGELHVALLLDPLGVVDVDGGHGRPLLQAGTGARGDRVGPGRVLEEPVDRVTLLVHNDLTQFGVVTGGKSGLLGLLGKAAPALLRLLAVRSERVPLATAALTRDVPGLGVLRVAVGRPAADGQLLAAVGAGHLAEQRLVDALARRGVV